MRGAGVVHESGGESEAVLHHFKDFDPPFKYF
jgi:hypothetical protein